MVDMNKVIKIHGTVPTSMLSDLLDIQGAQIKLVLQTRHSH